MQHHTNLSKGFWVEVGLTIVHVFNLSLNIAIDMKVAKQLWTSMTFECEAYAHVSKQLRQESNYKSRKCIFPGYRINDHFGYHL